MNQNNSNSNDRQQGKENGIFHLGYSATNDIYVKSKNEVDIDPEDISEKKSENEENEMEYDENEMGGELDVPGSELDDEQEQIGAEDEENNYYSLGLDNHNELRENNEE